MSQRQPKVRLADSRQASVSPRGEKHRGHDQAMPRTRTILGGMFHQQIRESRGLARRGGDAGAQDKGGGRCHSTGLTDVVLLGTSQIAGFGFPTASAEEGAVACWFQRLIAGDTG